MRIGLGVVALGWLLGVSVADVDAEEASAPATIAGKVTDKVTGEPVIDAGVEVVGQNVTARTDVDGRFAVKVPPGRHQVRFFAPLYQAMRLENVQAVAGRVATLNATLTPTQAGLEVVEVVAQADKAAEATQLQQRRNAPVVSE